MRALFFTGLLLTLSACGAGSDPEGLPPGDDEPGSSDSEPLPRPEPERPVLRCESIQLAPDALDWGIVRTGYRSEAKVVLTNPSSALCGVRVKVEGDGFSTDAKWLVLPAGGEATVSVQLEPVEAGPAAGVLHVLGAQDLDELPLTAEVRTSCLQAQTEAIDFGVVPTCRRVSERIALRNDCSHPATYDAVLGDGSLDRDAPVAIVSWPPFEIPAHDVAHFEVEYRPDHDMAPWQGALVVYEGDQNIPVEIRAGGGELPAAITDVFRQGSWHRINFLFVVDDAPETAPWLDAISDWVEYHHALHRNVAHIRWGVTTTSRIATQGCPGSGADGRLLPLDGSGPRWLDINGEPPPSTEELHSLFDVPTCSQASSEAFASIERSILELADLDDDPTHPEPADGNAGFLLEAPAALRVVVFSARDDASLGTVQDWQEALLPFYGPNPSLFYVDAIAGDPSCPGTEDGVRLRALVDAHEGAYGTICDPYTWPEFAISGPFGTSSRFFLPNFPFDRNGDGDFEDDIEVEVNGELIAPTMGGERVWSYHRQTNAIDFSPTHIPRESAEVRVTYRPANC